MRLTLCILSIIAPIASSGALAEQRYKSAYDDPVICSTAVEARQAFSARSDRSSEDVSGAQAINGSCRKMAPGQTFAVINGSRSDDSVKTIRSLSYDNSTYMAYLAGPIERVAETSAPLQKNCSEGETGPAGEVRRMEVGANGQLFLKRYMITSRCVDGILRSFTKRLN